jgi:hypothetical protein
MSEASSNEFQIIISVLGGIILILIVSEILPFIKNIKSNGLIELLVNIWESYKNIEENEPLINDLENIIDNRTEQHNSVIELQPQLSEQLDSLNIAVNNITHTLNNYINEAQHSRQLKLQSIELYELNYIINYIKVNYPKKMFQTRFLSKTNKQLLISQGYVVDYDSQNDTHTIKW